MFKHVNEIKRGAPKNFTASKVSFSSIPISVQLRIVYFNNIRIILNNQTLDKTHLFITLLIYIYSVCFVCFFRLKRPFFISFRQWRDRART